MYMQSNILDVTCSNIFNINTRLDIRRQMKWGVKGTQQRKDRTGRNGTDKGQDPTGRGNK